MSFIDLIKNLNINITPSWSKQAGVNSTESHQKAKSNQGIMAGRDVTINQGITNSPKQDLPYVYLNATFGGNGGKLRLQNCKTYNLSGDFIFIEKIEVLGRTIPFEDTLIKAGEKIHHTGIDDLDYPSSNSPQFSIITFYRKNKEYFTARQELNLTPRVDGRFNVSISQHAEVSRDIGFK